MHKFERVGKFIYLSMVIDEEINEKQELYARMAKENKQLGNLKSQIKSKYVLIL